MKLIKAINDGLKNNWTCLNEIFGREVYLLTDKAKEVTFDEIWIRAKSLLFVKDLPKPQINIGDEVVVFDCYGTWRLEKGVIEKKSSDVETCFGYRSNADSKLKMLCSNLNLWGSYPFSLPDFNIQKEFYLKNMDRVEEISCCYLHRNCVVMGRCISQAYEEMGIKYNCSIAKKLEERKIEPKRIREVRVEQDGQLALF